LKNTKFWSKGVIYYAPTMSSEIVAGLHKRTALQRSQYRIMREIMGDVFR